MVAGDVVRRLVARTISQQRAHQCAMSTRAGCECVAHALQGLTELDPNATVTSVDGISAFDMISRQSMFGGSPSTSGWKHRPFRPLVLWAAVGV